MPTKRPRLSATQKAEVKRALTQQRAAEREREMALVQQVRRYFREELAVSEIVPSAAELRRMTEQVPSSDTTSLHSARRERRESFTVGEVRQPTYTVRDPVTGETASKTSRVWWIRYYRDGKRHEESSKSKSKQAAVNLLRIREGDVAKGLPVTSKMAKLRFEEAVADVVNDYKVNGRRSCAEVERRITLHLNPFFEGRRMVTLTTADVRAFTAARQDAGASNAEINRELAILKRAFRLAQQADKLLQRPHIPLLDENNVRQGFFERAEFEDVRAKLPADLRGVVTFAYLTGWRLRSEVLPLQWPQVDRQARVMRLEPGQTKNAEGRTLPYGLLPELVDVIEAQWQDHERLRAAGTICPFVFHRNGKPITTFRKTWHTACESAGVPGKILHDFRRTAVRNLVRAGVPERTAMQVTGHKTRSVFDRYDIVNEADLREAIGKLAPSVAGKEKGKKPRSGRVRRFR